jgi:hypothetical protein
MGPLHTTIEEFAADSRMSSAIALDVALIECYSGSRQS